MENKYPDKTETKKRLKKLLKPYTEVYTSLKSVSPSGMTRHIGVYIVDKKEIRDITWMVADVLGYRVSEKTSGLVVGGTGMDMGFHVVYSLSGALFPKGFRIKKGHCGRNGDISGFDKDGGYALKQRWL